MNDLSLRAQASREHYTTEQSLAMLRNEVRETTDVRDGLNELRERRIAAIEEVLAAPWPRRWLLAWGFRRRLRRSTRECAWAGRSWYERRAQETSEELYKMRGYGHA